VRAEDCPGVGNAASSFASTVRGDGVKAGHTTPSRAWRASLADCITSKRLRRDVHRAVDAPEGGLDECGQAESVVIGSKKDAWKSEYRGELIGEGEGLG